MIKYYLGSMCMPHIIRISHDLRSYISKDTSHDSIIPSVRDGGMSEESTSSVLHRDY